jgi:glycosyltransferase involved in cell wall biosynthesis
MRVLYLNPFSQEVSGPDESLLTLLRALVPLGIEPHVVLPRPGPHVPRYEALGAAVHLAPLTVLRRRQGLATAALPFRLMRGAATVARIARRVRAELIHTNMEVVLDGAIASRMLRLPHVLHYRGNTNDDPRVVFDVLTRFWTATSERVFCISAATAEIFRKRGLGEKVEVLHNPVDVEAFGRAARSDAVRAELGAARGDLLVGTVGRIHPRKDVATFLKACGLVLRERPQARFTLVGSAEVPEEVAYRREMIALAESLGIAERVVWAGARRDMPEVLKALDVFVLCSRNEGFGRVVAEALAAGTPVVATREGGIPEIVRGAPHARLASALDARGFADGVAELASAPALARAPSAPIDLAPERVAQRVLRTYAALTARRPPAVSEPSPRG